MKIPKDVVLTFCNHLLAWGTPLDTTDTTLWDGRLADAMRLLLSNWILEWLCEHGNNFLGSLPSPSSNPPIFIRYHANIGCDPHIQDRDPMEEAAYEKNITRRHDLFQRPKEVDGTEYRIGTRVNVFGSGKGNGHILCFRAADWTFPSDPKPLIPPVITIDSILRDRIERPGTLIHPHDEPRFRDRWYLIHPASKRASIFPWGALVHDPVDAIGTTPYRRAKYWYDKMISQGYSASNTLPSAIDAFNNGIATYQSNKRQITLMVTTYYIVPALVDIVWSYHGRII
jgi:hypothetical protein